jgi:hypothetical protein
VSEPRASTPWKESSEGFPEDIKECWARCGRRLWCVIEVVYDSPSDDEGGGVLLR